MKHHGLGTYPMYHTEKTLDRKMYDKIDEVIYEKRQVTLCHTDNIEVGDTIKYKHPKDLVFTVIEVLEEREAKGNHPNGATFYNLVLEFKK